MVYDKPFLGPLFTFFGLHGPGKKRQLPLYVLIVMKWLRDKLKERRTYRGQSRRTIKKSVLRVDAKAEGLVVAVGGWSPFYDEDGAIVKDKSKWFSVRLTEAEAPWAFVKGKPSRAISTLELLATTVGLVLLAPVALARPGVAGSVTVTGFTDSLVSASVVTRGLTTAPPLCAVAMELAAQLEARNAELLLEWVPREQNAEADMLADGRSAGFSENDRVQASLKQIRWLVLDRLLEAGAAFHREAERFKQRVPGGTVKRRGRLGLGGAKRLKDREPW